MYKVSCKVFYCVSACPCKALVMFYFRWCCYCCCFSCLSLSPHLVLLFYSHTFTYKMVMRQQLLLLAAIAAYFYEHWVLRRKQTILPYIQSNNQCFQPRIISIILLSAAINWMYSGVCAHIPFDTSRYFIVLHFNAILRNFSLLFSYSLFWCLRSYSKQSIKRKMLIFLFSTLIQVCLCVRVRTKKVCLLKYICYVDSFDL